MACFLQPDIVEVYVKLSSRMSALPFAAVTLVIAAPVASAQSADAIDMSVAHQTLRIPGQTFPIGFNVDVSKPIANPWRIVGEFGASHDRVDNAFENGTLNLFQFGAGPRLAMTTGRVAPYAQLVAGGVHTDAHLTHPAAPPTIDGDWAFMLQPGAGLRVPVSNGIGALTQVDYRRVFFKEQGDNEWRFVVGGYFTFR